MERGSGYIRTGRGGGNGEWCGGDRQVLAMEEDWWKSEWRKESGRQGRRL